MSRLAKLIQLFEEGVELPLSTSSGETMVVWVNKLSPFQQEQANQEGRIGRARRMLAIREVGTPEFEIFRANAGGMAKEAIVEAIVTAKSDELLGKAMRSIRADEEWRERIEVIEHSGDQAVQLKDGDPELELLAKAAGEYQQEIVRRHEDLRLDLQADLDGRGREELMEHYEEVYVEAQGLAAFHDHRQRQELYFCMRACEAPDLDHAGCDHDRGPCELKYDHSKCQHTDLFLTDPYEVDVLPGDVQTAVVRAYSELIVPSDLARFMEGPASSSASSGPSSSPEGSEGSGPGATSSEPATT